MSAADRAQIAKSAASRRALRSKAALAAAARAAAMAKTLANLPPHTARICNSRATATARGTRAGTDSQT